MIESSYQIDFLSSSGTVRLLEIGAIVANDPVLSVAQRDTRYAAIGAEWIECRAEGAAEVSLSWVMVRNHASHAALHSYCMRHAASLPSGQTGIIRVTVNGGEVWDIEDAVVLSSNPLPLMESGQFETVTSYTAAGGRMVPAAPITLYAGIPWQFILQDWDGMSGEWDDL